MTWQPPRLDYSLATLYGRLLTPSVSCVLQGVASLKRQLLELLASARLAPSGMKQSWVEGLGRREDGGSDGVRMALECGAEQARRALTTP